MTDPQHHPDLSEHLASLDVNVKRAADELHEQRLAYERKLTTANEALAASEQATRSAKRAAWLIGVLAVIGALVNSGLYRSVRSEADQRAAEAERRARDEVAEKIVICVNGNRTRTELIASIDARFGHYTESLAKVTGADRTPEQVTKVDQQVAAIAAELAAIPWSPIIAEPGLLPEAVLSPTPVTER